MHSWHNFTGGGGGRVNPLMGRKSLLKKKMKKKKKKKREREREREIERERDRGRHH